MWGALMSWVDEAGQLIVTAGGTAVALRLVGFRFWKEKQKPPAPVCGCEHGFSFHDLRTGECHAKDKIADTWNNNGSPIHWGRIPCTCRHYTGPIPVDLEFRPPPLMPREDT